MIEVQSFKDGEPYTDWRPSAFEADSQEYKNIEEYLKTTDPVVLKVGRWEFHYRKMI